MTRHPSAHARRSLLPAATAILALLAAGCADQSPLAPTRALASNGASTDRDGGAFHFDTIDVPGALLTSPQGINARGDISGSYVDANLRSHGFLLHDGSFTTIDYPGADGTNVEGIGPSGDVVGTHWLNTEEPTALHGFRRSADGTFQSVHYTSHLYEIPQRILPDGTVLGCRHDHDLMNSMRGIVIGRADTSEVDAYSSMSNGATPDRHLVVGLFREMMNAPAQGFKLIDGVFTAFMIPGSTATTAWDVNPRGDIVGVYNNGAVAHGYLLTSSGATPIDVPGAAATRAFGINAGGAVVGTFTAGGKTHGFLATQM